MTDRKNTKTQSVAEHETLQTQKQIEEKKEQARRLLKGGTQKNKAKAVELLEDCVALGDADSMLTLAKCYVLGCGIEQNTERAEDLLSECAMKGNREAMLLMKFNKDWKGQDSIDLERLFVSLHVGTSTAHFLWPLTEKVRGKCTFARFLIIMSIEKWKTVNLSCVLNRLIRCKVQTCITDNHFGGFYRQPDW